MNQTSGALRVATQLVADPAWKISGETHATIDLAAAETRWVTIPIRLIGYKANAQLCPIRLQFATENFKTEIIRDFYVGIVLFANSPPALDGSWDGWNTANPLTIDHANQVCKLLLGNQPWAGPEDLSAKIYTMYDDHYLYVGAAVRDNVVVTIWDFPVMSYPWDTDCMEVVLDARTGSAQGSDPPPPDFSGICPWPSIAAPSSVRKNGKAAPTAPRCRNPCSFPMRRRFSISPGLATI